MDEIFDRIYSLTIGRNATLAETNIPQLLVRPQPGVPQLLARSDWNTIPAQKITINDLQIVADISYTKEGKTNKQATTIEIYNLSKENIRFISTSDSVLLSAGYRSIHKNTPPLIFSGQILKVKTKKNGVDTSITTLYCVPAEVARKNIRFSKSPIRNESTQDIANYFADFAAANGIPKGNVWVPSTRLVYFPSGYSANGSLFSELEKFCSNWGFYHYITLGRLYIEPVGTGLDAIAKVIVGEDNIKDSIRPEDDATNESLSDDNRKSGLVFNTFLNADITPAKLVNINFGEYRGDYLISSVQHKLDLEGNDWDTIISCKRRTQ